MTFVIILLLSELIDGPATHLGISWDVSTGCDLDLVTQRTVTQQSTTSIWHSWWCESAILDNRRKVSVCLSVRLLHMPLWLTAALDHNSRSRLTRLLHGISWRINPVFVRCTLSVCAAGRVPVKPSADTLNCLCVCWERMLMRDATPRVGSGIQRQLSRLPPASRVSLCK